MSKQPENPRAFPVSTIDGFTADGMTLRDYFAAAALQSIGGAYSNTHYPDAEHDKKTHEFIANHAYGIADAMLKARSS